MVSEEVEQSNTSRCWVATILLRVIVTFDNYFIDPSLATSLLMNVLILCLYVFKEF